MSSRRGISPAGRFRGFKLATPLLVAVLVIACGPSPLPKTRPPADRHAPYDYAARTALVMAANPLAAEAGRDMFLQGGNAVDAAIAASFALNAAEPFASGLGGGGFMVIYLAQENRVTVIDFRERAPLAAGPSMFIDDGKLNKTWKESHGLAVAVPGTPAGWDYALKRYGTKTLAQVAERGIEIADKGFPVGPTLSAVDKEKQERLLANSGEDSVYLKNGRPYEVDDTFRNPELARTFKTIADKGIAEFYRGPLARRIVEAVRAKGGNMTLEDLASYRPVETEPLKGTYKSYTLYTVPPPSAGGLHAVELLNILDNWPVKTWGYNSPAYIHHFAEALRFVFADRERFLGDPDFVKVPVKDIADKAYAARIAAGIKPDRVAGDYPGGDFVLKHGQEGNTSHLCAVDRFGNIVALTQSLNDFFGSGISPRGSGFLLNNCMDDFDDDPAGRNAPGPRRRPLSSMAPLILFRKGRPVLALGSPGATRIFSTLDQIILNVVEFEMSLDEAIESPRFFSYSAARKAAPIFCESRISEETRRALEKLGHEVSVKEAYDRYFGGAQGILFLRGGKLLQGGADSRRDGAGAGF